MPTRLLPFNAAFLLLLPIVEIWLLITVGSHIGALATILLLLAAGMLGMALLRQQGLGLLQKLQGSLMRGEDPSQTLQDGALLALAAFLFLIPGFFTDLIGLLCLIPAARRLIGNYLFKRTGTSGFQHHTHSIGRVIEGEVLHRQHDDRT